MNKKIISSLVGLTLVFLLSFPLFAEEGKKEGENISIRLEASYVPPENEKEEDSPQPPVGETRPAIKSLTEEMEDRKSAAEKEALLEFLAAAQGVNRPDGAWSTTEGDMTIWTFRDGTFRASYDQDSGRILGEINGGVLHGHWIENDSNQRCGEPMEGSFHWGKLRFVFDPQQDSFEGSWGYCDETPASAWTGSRTKKSREQLLEGLRARYEKELMKPQAGSDPAQLAVNLDQALETWMEAYAPGGKLYLTKLRMRDAEGDVEYSQKNFASPGMKGELPGNVQPAGKVDHEEDDPLVIELLQSIQESRERLRVQMSSKPSKPQDVSPRDGEEGKRQKEDTTDILEDYAPGGKKTYVTSGIEDPYAPRKLDLPSPADLKQALKRRIEENLVKELDKHFPEFRSIQGDTEMKKAVEKIAKILEEGGGDLSSMDNFQRFKVLRVLDEAIDKALSPKKPVQTTPEAKLTPDLPQEKSVAEEPKLEVL